MAKLFRIFRSLRRYKSKNGQQVYIRIRMNGGADIEIPVYDHINQQRLAISVNKEHWNKGYVTGGEYHISIRELNNLLSKIEHNVKDAVNELIENNIPLTRDNILRLTYITSAIKSKAVIDDMSDENHGDKLVSKKNFEKFILHSDDPSLDDIKKSMGLNKREYILDYWSDFIKSYAPDSYDSPRYSIEEYIKKTGDNCRITEFNEEWLIRFFEHIIKNGYSFRKDGTNRKDYTITTISKYQKHLRSFGDYLFEERKVLNNQSYRRFSLKKSAKKKSIIKYKSEPYINTHALYKREFDWYYTFKFADKEHRIARDMFIMQTWLGGLRQVDFYKISENNFHKDSKGVYKVWFEQKKTDDEVINVINQNYIVPILERHSNGFFEFPPVHEYNKMLKESAKIAGLNRKLKFRFEYANANEATEQWIEIHKMITNCWARNCAVSILSELGYPDDRICKFTGHRDLQMIKHYKSVHQKEISRMMDEVRPEFVKEL